MKAENWGYCNVATGTILTAQTHTNTTHRLKIHVRPRLTTRTTINYNMRPPYQCVFSKKTLWWCNTIVWVCVCVCGRLENRPNWPAQFGPKNCTNFSGIFLLRRGVVTLKDVAAAAATAEFENAPGCN